MKRIFPYTLAVAAVLAVSQSSHLCAQETAAPKDAPMGRVDSAHVTLSAEVTAIDLAKREVTLKGPQGKEVTVTVNPAVKRLDEVKVGDTVRVDYLVSMVAEIRKPTAAESEHPLVIMDAAGRAPGDAEPAGGVARRFKVVTTIEVLNGVDQTVTVKGPMGHYLTAKVADPERLTKVHIGETIVITYTEALALSLDPVAK